MAVHISHAFPPRRAYKLSDEGLVATLWPSSSSGGGSGVTKTARSQPSRKQVLFLANYTTKLWDIMTVPGSGVSHDKAGKRQGGGFGAVCGAGMMNVDIYPKSNACLISHLELIEHVGKLQSLGSRSAERKKNVAPSLTLRLNYLLYC